MYYVGYALLIIMNVLIYLWGGHWLSMLAVGFVLGLATAQFINSKI